MSMFRTLLPAAACALALASPIVATAGTTHTLDLIGDNSLVAPTTFESGGFTFQVIEVPLFEVGTNGGFSSFELSDGDTIEFNIGFSVVFDVPAAVAGGIQFLGVNFTGDAPEPTSVSNAGEFTLDGVNPADAVTNPLITNCGNCLSAISGIDGPAPNYQFKSLTGSSVFTLSAPYQITGASISYQVQIAVIPEPASWAMLVAGLGLVGALQRRRKHSVVA